MFPSLSLSRNAAAAAIGHGHGDGCGCGLGFGCGHESGALITGLLGPRDALASRGPLRTIGVVARGLIGRAATAPMVRRRPASEPGEPGWSVPPGGARHGLCAERNAPPRRSSGTKSCPAPRGGAVSRVPWSASVTGSDTEPAAVSATDAVTESATDSTQLRIDESRG